MASVRASQGSFEVIVRARGYIRQREVVQETLRRDT
jgi:hypothetical protein